MKIKVVSKESAFVALCNELKDQINRQSAEIEAQRVLIRKAENETAMYKDSLDAARELYENLAYCLTHAIYFNKFDKNIYLNDENLLCTGLAEAEYMLTKEADARENYHKTEIENYKAFIHELEREIEYQRGLVKQLEKEREHIE